MSVLSPRRLRHERLRPQPTHATSAFTGNSVVMVSNGVSGVGIGVHCARNTLSSYHVIATGNPG